MEFEPYEHMPAAAVAMEEDFEPDEDTAEVIEVLAEKQLPLVSNIDDVRVVHYMLNLNFLMEEQTVEGSAVLFIKRVRKRTTNTDQPPHSHCSIPDINEIVLDCSHLEITRVSLVSDRFCVVKQGNTKWDNYWLKRDSMEELSYVLTKSTLVISGWTKFPFVIRISYKTLLDTPGISWRPSNGGYEYNSCSLKEKCAYTSAGEELSFSRGLFPCQESPKSKATWDALVTIPNTLSVLTSSDEIGQEVMLDNEDESRTDALTATTLFTSRVHSPISEFGIFVGHFLTQKDGFLVCLDPKLTVRLFSTTRSMIPEDLPTFTRNILLSTVKILGPLPFSRMDLVIMPTCFHHLGIAHPHMIFLSPCLLNGSNELLIYERIAQVIVLSWFYMNIGVLESDDRWLNEALAAFLAEEVYKDVRLIEGDIDQHDLEGELELKLGLRLFNLQEELKHGDVAAFNLDVVVEETTSCPSIKPESFPLSQFLHISESKGYFFFRHLSEVVGPKRFLLFVKKFVECYSKKQKLMTPNRFLNIFYRTFGNPLTLAGESIEDLKRAWLTNPQLPEPLKSIDIFAGNRSPGFEAFFKNKSGFYNGKKAFVKFLRGLSSSVSSGLLTSNELIFFFEQFIRRAGDASADPEDLDRMQNLLNIVPEDENPEVVHRWCELIIITHKSSNNIPQHLRKFISDYLTENRAMSVCIYGELANSNNEVFQKMAIDLFKLQEHTFDSATKQLISDQVFWPE